jgi:hypothetical protein
LKEESALDDVQTLQLAVQRRGSATRQPDVVDPNRMLDDCWDGLRLLDEDR